MRPSVALLGALVLAGCFFVEEGNFVLTNEDARERTFTAALFRDDGERLVERTVTLASRSREMIELGSEGGGTFRVVASGEGYATYNDVLNAGGTTWWITVSANATGFRVYSLHGD